MSERTIDSRPAGMGDAVVGLWIAEGARARGERILFVDNGHGDIVRAFGHETVSEPSEDCMALGYGTRTYHDEFLCGPVDGTPRTRLWQRTMGWDYEPRCPTLRPLPDDASGWGQGMRNDGPFVAIAPKANVGSRTAPIQKWLRVAWALQHAGIRTIAIDSSREVVEAFPFYVYGFNWPHVLALLSRAAVVAGNDSGIAHLSASLGVPTVVAMGPTDPGVVFGHCPERVTLVRTDQVDCVGCHFMGSRGFQLACDRGCEALEMLGWQQMRDAVVEAFVRRLAIA